MISGMRNRIFILCLPSPPLPPPSHPFHYAMSNNSFALFYMRSLCAEQYFAVFCFHIRSQVLWEILNALNPFRDWRREKGTTVKKKKIGNKRNTKYSERTNEQVFVIK